MVVKELFAKLGLDFEPSGFKQADSALSMLKWGLAGISAAVLAAGATIKHFVSNIADEAGDISRAATRLGLTTDAIQEMRAAARGAGVDAESLEAGLKFLERNAYEAAHGSQELAAKFNQIHISASAFAKLKPDEQLRVLADKLADMKDPGERAAIALGLMGRQGTALLPVLSKGRAGIDELAQKAHEFGTVMDEDLIARSEEYRKTNRELGEAFEGLKLAILGPLVQASALKKKLTELIVANRQLIAQAAHRVFRFLADAAKGAVAVLKAMATTIDELIKNTIGWKVAIVVIASAIALWGVIALGPWLALAAAIAAVLLVLEDIGVFLEGGDSLIGDYAGKLSHLWDPVTNALKTAADFWRRLFEDFFNWLDSKTAGKASKIANNTAGSFLHYAGKIPGMSSFNDWVNGKGSQARADADFAYRKYGQSSPEYAAAYQQASSAGVKFKPGSEPGAVTVNQTINATPGMDIKAVADAAAQSVAEALAKQNREAAAAHSP